MVAQKIHDDTPLTNVDFAVAWGRGPCPASGRSRGARQRHGTRLPRGAWFDLYVPRDQYEACESELHGVVRHHSATSPRLPLLLEKHAAFMTGPNRARFPWIAPPPPRRPKRGKQQKSRTRGRRAAPQGCGRPPLLIVLLHSLIYLPRWRRRRGGCLEPGPGLAGVCVADENERRPGGLPRVADWRARAAFVSSRLTIKQNRSFCAFLVSYTPLANCARLVRARFGRLTPGSAAEASHTGSHGCQPQRAKVKNASLRQMDTGAPSSSNRGRRNKARRLARRERPLVPRDRRPRCHNSGRVRRDGRRPRHVQRPRARGPRGRDRTTARGGTVYADGRRPHDAPCRLRGQVAGVSPTGAASGCRAASTSSPADSPGSPSVDGPGHRVIWRRGHKCGKLFCWCHRVHTYGEDIARTTNLTRSRRWRPSPVEHEIKCAAGPSRPTTARWRLWHGASSATSVPI